MYRRCNPFGAKAERSGTIVCIATGPSLTRADCEKAERAPAKVIAVNDAWRLAPSADYLYACDERWWRHHWDEVEAFAGEKWTQAHNDTTRAFAEAWGLNYKPGAGQGGLGLDKIHHGANSGYQAINLAYLFGAERIILLGYDMGATGDTHFFGSHPKGLFNGNYRSFVPNFDRLALDLKRQGVDVINCTRNTALTQFPRKSLEEVLD